MYKISIFICYRQTTTKKSVESKINYGICFKISNKTNTLFKFAFAQFAVVKRGVKG